MDNLGIERFISKYGLEIDDLPMIQQFVHGAYIIFTSWEVNHHCKYEDILSRISLKHIDQPGLSLFTRYFDNYLKNEFEAVPKVFDNYFLAFLNLDMFFSKIGFSLSLDEMSFEYEALSCLSNERLLELGDLIDRIQILISSHCLCDDFRVALKRLLNCSGYNFSNRRSEFDFSNTVNNQKRIMKLLAMYRATTKPSFFATDFEYYTFLRKTYEWLIRKSELITSILYPSRRKKDESRFYVSLLFLDDLPKAEISTLAKEVIPYFRICLTINQPLFTNRLRHCQYCLFMPFMKQIQKSKYTESSESSVLQSRIRKIFLDFLVGYSFEYNRSGTLVLTKELYYLQKLSFSCTYSYSLRFAFDPAEFHSKFQIRSFKQSQEDRKARDKFKRSFYSSQVFQRRPVLLTEERIIFPVPIFETAFSQEERELFKEVGLLETLLEWGELWKAQMAALRKKLCVCDQDF